MFKAKNALYLALLTTLGCGGPDEAADNSTSSNSSIISSAINSNSVDNPESNSSSESSSSNSPDATTQTCLNFSPSEVSGELTDSSITTISGLTASRINQGVLYGIVDAGGPAAVYVFTIEGNLLGTITLADVNQHDWEDISTGPGANGEPNIYIGDIGDNAARQGGTPRENISIYRFNEPEIDIDTAGFSIEQSEFEKIELQYPEQAHDAETLAIHPTTGDIFIFSKEDDGHTFLFTAPFIDAPAATPAELELIADINLGATGQAGQVSAGDIDPMGQRFILRTYTSIFLWEYQQSLENTFAQPANTLPAAEEPQSEGLTFSADGEAWYSMGERSGTIYRGTANCN